MKFEKNLKFNFFETQNPDIILLHSMSGGLKSWRPFLETRDKYIVLGDFGANPYRTHFRANFRAFSNRPSKTLMKIMGNEIMFVDTENRLSLLLPSYHEKIVPLEILEILLGSCVV